MFTDQHWSDLYWSILIGSVLISIDPICIDPICINWHWSLSHRYNQHWSGCVNAGIHCGVRITLWCTLSMCVFRDTGEHGCMHWCFTIWAHHVQIHVLSGKGSTIKYLGWTWNKLEEKNWGLFSIKKIHRGTPGGKIIWFFSPAPPPDHIKCWPLNTYRLI